jgi:hypothetical protein
MTTQSNFHHDFNQALEEACAAEEAALRAATIRDRAKGDDFERKANQTLYELEQVQKDAEELIFDMDCKKARETLGAQAKRKVQTTIVGELFVLDWSEMRWSDPLSNLQILADSGVE